MEAQSHSIPVWPLFHLPDIPNRVLRGIVFGFQYIGEGLVAPTQSLKGLVQSNKLPVDGSNFTLILRNVVLKNIGR